MLIVNYSSQILLQIEVIRYNEFVIRKGAKNVINWGASTPKRLQMGLRGILLTGKWKLSKLVNPKSDYGLLDIQKINFLLAKMDVVNFSASELDDDDKHLNHRKPFSWEWDLDNNSIIQ